MSRIARMIGWTMVWTLFVLFNLLLLTNRIEHLMTLTLYSLLPIWVLTVVGGSIEVAALLRQRGQAALADATQAKGIEND